MTRTPAPRRGAYGIALAGGPLDEDLLVPAEDTWPEVRVEQRLGARPFSTTTFEQDRAQFDLAAGGLLLDRTSGRAVFTTAEPLGHQALVHPYLGPVGATFALWSGREAMHAGGFAGATGTWGLLGDRESGKSSTLASLFVAGVDIVCDDVLVVDGTTAFAGPRCIDLRGPTARRLGLGDHLRFPGDRERWRVVLPPTPPTSRMCGWVCLEWGDEVKLARVPVVHRFHRLAPHRSMLGVPPQPTTLLDLATYPMWTLTRPKTWTVMPEVLGLLRDLAEA